MLPIAFLSDVEGSLRKLHDFFARHEAFERGADGRFHLREGHIFVHGGDAPDRFLGSIGVVDELVRLKDEAPQRVILVAGNRDVNKLRLPMELSDAALAAGPQERAEDWHASLIADGGTGPDAQRLNTRPRRLRWILKRTMGAAEAFELRRQELEGMGLPASDDEVVESYLADLGPGGRFRRFLEASCLLHRVGNTLFTHAGLTEPSLLSVPGESRAATLDGWIERLNAWYQAQLAEWRSDWASWAGTGRRPGEELIRYCQPNAGTGANPSSVVYSRNADAQGKISLPAGSVVQYLLSAGIRRVAVGHTPSGDLPVLLRTDDDAFEQVVSDTSRSRDAETAALVTIHGADQQSVEVRASYRTGEGTQEPVSFRTRLGEPSLLGKRLENGALVVAPIGQRYLTYQLKPGWKVEYQVVDGVPSAH